MSGETFNPRWLAYCRANGRDSGSQLAHDREEWKGGAMCGFILWCREQLPIFSKANPGAFRLGTLVDHAAYDAWLGARYP